MSEPETNQFSELNDDRLENLRALYESTVLEVTNLRDHEWRITEYFILLSAGIVGLVVSDSIRPLLTYEVRLALTIIQVVAMFVGCLLLCKTHYYLTKNRHLRRRIERILRFHETNVYLKAESILPTRWKTEDVRFTFQLWDLFIPLQVATLLAQIASICLLWKLQ